MTQLAEASRPLWKDAPPSIRTTFEAMAKKEKQKFNVPEHKYTLNGISNAELDQQARELQEAAASELNDIKNIVTSKGLDYAGNNLDIYLIDVIFYCKASVDSVIGELTVLCFIIQEGIKEYYHEMINPGRSPTGNASDAKPSSHELGLPMPYEAADSNYLHVSAHLIGFLRQSQAAGVLRCVARVGSTEQGPLQVHPWHRVQTPRGG